MAKAVFNVSFDLTVTASCSDPEVTEDHLVDYVQQDLCEMLGNGWVSHPTAAAMSVKCEVGGIAMAKDAELEDIFKEIIVAQACVDEHNIYGMRASISNAYMLMNKYRK